MFRKAYGLPTNDKGIWSSRNFSKNLTAFISTFLSRDVLQNISRRPHVKSRSVERKFVCRRWQIQIEEKSSNLIKLFVREQVCAPHVTFAILCREYGNVPPVWVGFTPKILLTRVLPMQIFSWVRVGLAEIQEKFTKWVVFHDNASWKWLLTQFLILEWSSFSKTGGSPVHPQVM